METRWTSALVNPETRLCNRLQEYFALVTCIHFRWHNKDGGYIIRSTVPEIPMLHENITALCLIERELLPIEVLHCGNRNFRPFWLLWLFPMTLYTNVTHSAWRYAACANRNFLCKGFQKLSSDRHTDTETRSKSSTTPLRGWSIIEARNPHFGNACEECTEDIYTGQVGNAVNADDVVSVLWRRRSRTGSDHPRRNTWRMNGHRAVDYVTGWLPVVCLPSQLIIDANDARSDATWPRPMREVNAIWPDVIGGGTCRVCVVANDPGLGLWAL